MDVYEVKGRIDAFFLSLFPSLFSLSFLLYEWIVTLIGALGYRGTQKTLHGFIALCCDRTLALTKDRPLCISHIYCISPGFTFLRASPKQPSSALAWNKTLGFM